MASNSRQARKEAQSLRDTLYDNYLARLCILYDNSVVIDNLPSDLPKRYFLKVLREKGAIAYDKATGLYLPFTAAGVDVYGLPLSYTLVGYDGYVVHRLADEVVIIRANDLRYSIQTYFEQQSRILTEYDMAIMQNLEAIKTMTIAEVADESTLLSVANELNAKRIGATVFVKNKSAMSGVKLTTTATGAQYLGDKLRQDRKEVFNETLATIGINVANTDKKERVQGEEVRASQGYAIDSIQTLIDTVNHDCEIGGLPIRLRGNTNLIKLNEIEMGEVNSGE